MAKRKLHPLLRLVRLVAIVWAALALFACTVGEKMIFMPQRPSYAATAPQLVRFETSEDESIASLHFPADAGKPTVLYSHGNAEDIGQSMDLYRAWQALGWGVLAYDYPGYGHSDGSPSEASCERAIEAAWDHLTTELKVPASDIVIVGRSVGGGPSVWLASENQARALVLISPFTSAFAVRSPAQYLLPGNRFPNLRRIRSIETPLLVIHGESDGIIPASHGRQIAEASAAGRKSYKGFPGAGHNDLFRLAGSEVFEEIRRFVEEEP